jgi:serine/threonine-protein kinase HipA
MAAKELKLLVFAHLASNWAHSFDIPSIECAALRLAATTGLTVLPVKVRTVGTRYVMLIRRFDRYWAEPGQALGPEDDLLTTKPGSGKAEHRLGFASGLTLVGSDETESATKAYSDLAQVQPIAGCGLRPAR